MNERTPGSSTSEPWLPSWDATYAANTGHHRVHDAWFLETLPLAADARVLDLGCGSGDFTRVVADRVPRGSVLGVDPQPALLREAESRAAANQSFLEGPVQRLATLLPGGDRFDVVLSRAAMHWVPEDDHPALLAQSLRLLRPGGWLRMEMGGAGNVPAVVALGNRVSPAYGGPARAPWSFFDPGRYLELLEVAGFIVDPAEGGYVRTVAQRRAFDRESLLGWLRSQCLQAFEVTMPPDRRSAFRSAMEQRLDELRRHDGGFDQTYVRLDLLARAPSRHAR